MTATVIGLGGRLRAGKDAVADYLVAHRGFVKLGMSDPLLEHALILDPMIPINAHPSTTVPGAMEGVFVPASLLVATVGYVEAKANPEFRRFMQKDGTEGGRQFHHENIWVQRAGRTIDSILEEGHPVVLTGLRFPNEIALIHSFGGRTVWVERPSEQADSGAAAHASENGVYPNQFDQTIYNDGTLAELYAEADALI